MLFFVTLTHTQAPTLLEVESPEGQQPGRLNFWDSSGPAHSLEVVGAQEMFPSTGRALQVASMGVVLIG